MIIIIIMMMMMKVILVSTVSRAVALISDTVQISDHINSYEIAG